ncbi:hypothetical protein XENOCAPTIV_024568, partial [Xenoophorus captivus]
YQGLFSVQRPLRAKHGSCRAASRESSSAASRASSTCSTANRTEKHPHMRIKD